jgi:TolB-like protein/Tfp pilus assembly protein PilF
MSFFNELKRRNVFRVGFAYAVVGWLVAQVADLALESFGAPEWVMKTLLFLMLTGFVLALFIAWAYELTPEGIRRAEDVDPNQSITHQTGHRLDRMVIVVLLLAVGMLLTERYLLVDSPEKGSGSISPELAQPQETTADKKLNLAPESEEPSVAVLPFVNMSSDPEQEYFSDGISEEILNVLTRIPNLKVAARTSSFQFKGQNLDIAKIGQQLQVNHILEGSVRKSGATLRITAQLVATDTGFHLWSETFDRKLVDVFAIQDEIAAAIAHELRTRLTTELDNTSTPVDMEAYELYLKGRGLVAKRREASLFEGIEILKAAIKIEPEYAPAMATLAKAYAVLPWFSRQTPAGEAREQARQWASRALELEPENVEALSILAVVYFEIDLNPRGAGQLLQRALDANPGSVTANNFMGDLATRTGDLDSALFYESRAAELDPLGTVQLTDLANIYALRGEYQKALTLARRALAVDPLFSNALFHVVDANYFLGNVEELAKEIQKIESLQILSEDQMGGLQIQLSIARGDREQAKKMLEQRAQQAKSDQISSVEVAFDAVYLGDFDTAGEMLLHAREKKDGTWTFPLLVRLPEQAPDSEPWQEFWRQPGIAELAELRRSHGFHPLAPSFDEGAQR